MGDDDTVAEELAWVRWRLDRMVSGRLVSPLSDVELEQFNMLSVREVELLQRATVTGTVITLRREVSLAQALALAGSG